MVKSNWVETYQNRIPMVKTRDGKNPKYVYRVMSRDEFDRAERVGLFIPGREGRIHASERPELRYRNSPNDVIVRFEYHIQDGWHAKWGGEKLYVVTDQRIPFDRASLVDGNLDESRIHSGKNIDLTWSLNTKDTAGLSSKWTLDKLDAYIDGELVGYLKVVYIDPKKSFTNIFYYMSKRGNGGMSPVDNPEVHWSQWSRNDKEQSLTSSPRMPMWNQYVKDEDGKYVFDKARVMINVVQTLSDEKLDELLKQAEITLNKQYGDEYKNFLFFQSKPYVDYVRTEKDWRRQGIGLAMYQEAARMYATRGKRFYASGIQSEEAQFAWEKMRSNGWVGKNKRGYYINPKRLPEVVEHKKLKETFFSANIDVLMPVINGLMKTAEARIEKRRPGTGSDQTTSRQG